MTEQSDIYPYAFSVRCLWAFFALCAAFLSPIAALLGLHQLPPERMADLIPGAIVGTCMFMFFAYLTVRALRFGIELTETTVRLRGFLWDTEIPLNQIATLSEEEAIDESGHCYMTFVARDEMGDELFRVDRRSYTKRMHEIGKAIELAMANSISG